MQTKEKPGIDTKKGDSCSKRAFSWAKTTFDQREKKLGFIDTNNQCTFAQMIHFPPHQLAMTSDGIGTKVELAERTGIYHTLGYDLVAMVADDLACIGAEPSNLSNILDVDVLDERIVDQLMKGLAAAAKEAKISITGGEIAELGNRIGGWGEGMHFNWCATALGPLPPGMPIDGSKTRPGDAVIGLKSQGLRSNGFSLARSILESEFGKNWHEAPFDKKRSWGEVLLTPSLIYSPIITEMLCRSIKPRGIVHVTGGGIVGNLKRILAREEVGADLHDLFPPHPEMVELQRLGDISDEKAYESWNMGHGMLLVVKAAQVEDAMNFLKTTPFEVKIVGTITKEPEILIGGVSHTL